MLSFKIFGIEFSFTNGIFEVLKNSKQLAIRGKQSDSLVTFYNLIKKYNGLQKKLNASELSRSLIEESGIIKYYKESQEVENKDRYENIIELLNSIDKSKKYDTNF